MDIKALNEMKNAKVEEMQKLVNLADAENRTLNSEEIETFDSLEKEVNDLEKNIEAFDKMQSVELAPVVEPKKSVEDVETKRFENMIRGIKNSDDPMTYDDGKVTVPTTIAQKIIDKVVEISPLFEMSDRYYINGNLVIPKYDANNSSIAMAYADEGSNADSGNIELVSITLKGYLGRALTKVSKSLINNSQFDIVDFVINKMAQAIAEFIEGELLYGTDGKIDGLSGVTLSKTAASSAAITADELMDVQDLVIDNYQANAIWIMNRATRNAIRKLKDEDGNYLLNRDLTAKWGYSLLGKDVYTSDKMDEIGTSKTVIYYGDMSGLATKISEDINISVLNERYAEQHMTGVLGFVELDAKVQDTQKISKLVMGTTSV